MLFRSWEGILRVALSAAAIYILAVAALRVIGSRALAKMSAYDLIVSIALGSLVAAVPMSTELTVADGITAIITFLVLQELTRFFQSRYRAAQHFVRERPHLLVWDGRLLEERMSSLAISADEIRAAVRQAGLLSLDDAQAVVLENDGAWSVMQRGDPPDFSALEGLDVPDYGPVEDGIAPLPRPAKAHESQTPASSVAGQM